MKQVILYTKPGCHLCDAVKQVIVKVRQRRAFDFASFNILDDPAVFDRYKHDIPVVTVDGREIARHRMTAAQLEAALAG